MPAAVGLRPDWEAKRVRAAAWGATYAACQPRIGRCVSLWSIAAKGPNGAWHLAHRHADPLVTGISLNLAAALAPGEAP